VPPPARQSPSLSSTIAELGRVAGPHITDLARLATAVQQERHRTGSSNTTGLTRSTVTWAILQLAAPLRDVLPDGTEQRLGRILRIGRTPAPAVAEVGLAPDLDRAVRSYLENRWGPGTIDLADVLLAILQDARDPARGLFPRRLHDLGVDIDAAVAAVAPYADRTAREADFSESVRRVRSRLGPDTVVAAAQIAEALQAGHPEYGGKTFADVVLTPGGPGHPTDMWLTDVAGLYRRDEVMASTHKVVDGTLVLLGLAELDPSLEEDLRRNGFLTRLQNEAKVRPRADVRDYTRWRSDSPAAEDQLGREPFAEVLAQQLSAMAEANGQDRGPFLIHLDGPWGAGKSSVLGFLRRRLESEFLVVEINAWREQKVGGSWWWTILDRLDQATRRTMPWYRWWWHRFHDRLRMDWVPYLVGALVLLAGIGWVATGPDLAAAASVADSMGKMWALALTVLGGLMAVARYLLPGRRGAAEGAVDRSPSPAEAVKELLAAGLVRAGRPVLFLVDDLDRCSADYVVDFLETVQTQLCHALSADSHGLYAVVAADGEWIRTSYAAHYESFGSISRPGRPLGYLFQEKVFQLRTRLPAVPSRTQRAYLQALLELPDGGSVAGRERAVQDIQAAMADAQTEAQLIEVASQATSIDVDPGTRQQLLGEAAVRFAQPRMRNAARHALLRFDHYLEPNPRNIKLFVNTYGALRALRTIEGVFVDAGPLALWTIVEIRWPFLADYLRAHPARLGQPELAVPDDIRALMDDRDVRAVLDDEAVGPLTTELVRQCCGMA
jgi:hypothetical protein